MVKPINVNKFDQNTVYDLDPPMPKWRFTSKIFGPAKAIPGVNFDNLFIESITLPNGEVLNQSPSFGGGRTLYFPDFPDVSTISVSFYETETGAANLALSAWRSAVKSPLGFYGLPANYKCSILTNMFGYASNTSPVMTVNVEGVWPSDNGTLELNYTEDERLVIITTMSADAIRHTNRLGEAL